MARVSVGRTARPRRRRSVRQPQARVLTKPSLRNGLGRTAKARTGRYVKAVTPKAVSGRANYLFYGDNLDILRSAAIPSESVDLCYLVSAEEFGHMIDRCIGILHTS